MWRDPQIIPLFVALVFVSFVIVKAGDVLYIEQPDGPVIVEKVSGESSRQGILDNSKARKRPPLTIITAMNCPPCKRFEEECLAELNAKGWVQGKHYSMYTMPLGTVTTPTFHWRGKVFLEGYTNRDDFMRKLKQAMNDG